MKRHFAFIYNGEKIEVDARREGDEVIIERDGKSYTVTMAKAAGAATPATDSEQAAAAASTDAGGAGDAGHPSQNAAGADGAAGAAGTSATSAGGPAKGGGTPAGAAEAGDVPAPMTGVIKEVLVAEGDTVTEGEKLMIMEAMKMDIEVSAIYGGTVKQIRVKVNDSVQEGQPLVLIG
mgnify:CR=1 FL=1